MQHPKPPVSFFGILLAVAALNQCPQPQLPQPSCPNVPPTQAQPNYGPPATQPGTASMEVDLSSNYVSTLASAAGVPTTTSNACGGTVCGADIQQISLIQQDSQGTYANMNLLGLQLAVWMTNPQNSNKVYLPSRTYTLLIQLVPHLISPATITSLPARQTLLNCGSTPSCGTYGVLVELAYFKLLKGSLIAFYGLPSVDCNSSNYDLIDQQVLTAVLELFNGYKDSAGNYHPPRNTPIAFSLDSALHNMGQLLNQQLSLIGVDLGTDQSLKIGLLFADNNGNAIGTPMTFAPHVPPLIDSHPAVLNFQEDWGIQIDTGLLQTAIAKFAATMATTPPSGDPSVTVNSTAISFSGTGVNVNLSATKPMGLCGNVSFTASTTITPNLCSCGGNNTNANLRVCMPPSPSINCTSGAATCGCAWVGSLLTGVTTFVGNFLSAVAQSFKGGMATATVGSGPGPCPDNSCTNLGMVQLSLGSDTLYAVELDVNGMFYLAGRSRLLDSTQPGRGTLPAPCP